ncbi:MAG: hypothetical protein WC516_06930 [Patescibacteria group bacterium]|jgi:hypothetical protein
MGLSEYTSRELLNGLIVSIKGDIANLQLANWCALKQDRMIELGKLLCVLEKVKVIL